MTDVARYRSGELSSTDLMKRAMEASHEVERGDTKDLHWHAGHETWDEGREDTKRIGDAAFKYVASFAAGAAVKPALTKLGAAAGEFVATETAALATAASETIAGAAAAAGPPLAGGLGGAAAAMELLHAWCEGDKRVRLGQLDAIDVATTVLLDVDVAFKRADLARHPGILPEKLVAGFVNTRFGQEHLPELQAAADEGARSAFDAILCGGRADYFRAHPEAAKRFDTDVAFNKGFEHVLWAAAQRDSAQRLDRIDAAIHARDARAAAQPAPIRG